MSPTEIQQKFETIREEIAKVIEGQHDVVEGTLLALFSHGHVLIEGPPGLGKTLLANVLGRVLSCDFRRVQCTPDLMPGDLVGHSVFDMKEQRFVFRPGPVFTNVLLADEVNRATPKTQSAMLECLQERQVTVDGKTYPIEQPFVTMATQNPLEYEGTYPLPEAQVDRFMFKLLIDYPSQEEETRILERYERGVSLLMGGRACAAIRGRDYVTPDDVLRIAPWALRHRIRLTPDAVIQEVTPDEILTKIFDSVEVPRG